MKRIADLTPADFERAPVWRYSGATDETAVMYATNRRELTDDERETFIARTQFVLGNGAQHVGFCSPVNDSEMDCLQPVILTQYGPVYFWFEHPPTHEFLASQWARLGVTREDVFPVHFRCTVPVSGRFVTGIITADNLTGAA